MKMIRIRSSLLWTFTGAFLAVLVGGVILQVLLIAAVLRPAAQHWRTTAHRAIAQNVASTVADALANGREAQLGEVLREAARTNPRIVLLYRDRSGKTIASRPETELPHRVQRMMRGVESGHGRWLLVSSPVMVEGVRRGELVVVPHFPDRSFGLEGAPRPWLLFLPLAAILAGIAGFLLFRGMARRLGRLEEMAARIAEGHLDARVTDVGRDEIGRLGEAFNAMSARLQESREKLQEVDRQRRRFLADVTHDLATPLTTIRGYAETLRNPSVPKNAEETEKYLRFIQEEADRMDALVADLLDLARVESGSIPLDLDRCDLVDVVRDEIDRHASAFREAGLRLSGPDDSVGGIVARVDRRRIEQLISNLLGNAMQYLPSGAGTEVKIEAEGERVVRITVEDDGPGFAEADLPHLFERFYRGNPARPAGGTGLGLAIVRGIARAHGGEAVARNRPAGGACVVVSLPRKLNEP